MGRITPGEAERLLIAWNEEREMRWALAACIAVAVLAQLHPVEFLPGLTHTAWSLIGSGSNILHHALAMVTHHSGGIQ
jgi:hypothetical protein